MGIVRINQLPEGSGSLTNDDIFIFMDDPSGSGITKKISLTEIAGAIGGGGGGGGLSDTDTYIFAQPGDDLATKYAAAKLLTPGGSAKSTTNRASLIVMPGTYTLSNTLEIDTEFVDIIGIGSSRLDRGCVCAVKVTNHPSATYANINIIANDVRIKGIETVGDFSENYFYLDNGTGSQSSLIVEECINGGSQPGFIKYGAGSSVLGSTFIHCVATGGEGAGWGFRGSFGCNESLTAKYIGCVGGDNSFYPSIFGHSATYINCSGGDYSFGDWAYFTSLDGTYIDCVGGDSSFYLGNGTFTNCVGGDYSFGGSSYGIFKNCTGGNNSFNAGITGSVAGTYINCICGLNSFGYFIDYLTGYFKYCVGGNNSFGTNGMVVTATLIGCQIDGNTTFPTGLLTSPGKIRLCIDGNYDIINADGV